MLEFHRILASQTAALADKIGHGGYYGESGVV